MYWETCLTVNSTWDREGLFLLLLVLFIVQLKNSAQRIVNWQWLQTLIKKDVFSLSRSKDFFFKPVINNRKKLTWKVFWIIILMYLLAVGMVCYIHSSWVWNLTFAVLWLSLTRLFITHASAVPHLAHCKHSTSLTVACSSVNLSPFTHRKHK